MPGWMSYWVWLELKWVGLETTLEKMSYAIKLT